MKGVRPVIDHDACTGCGLCVRVCTPMALELRHGRPVVERPDWCSGCVQCSAVCPEGAIVVPGFEPPEQPRPGREPAVDPERLLLLLRERRSVRAYRKQPVPREHLEQLVQAGRYAPTGTNSQSVGWIVFGAPEGVRELRSRVFSFYEALFRLVQRRPTRAALRLVAGRDTTAILTDYLPVAEEAGRRLEAGDDRLLHSAPAAMLVHGPKGDPSSPFNCAVALYHASLMAHALGLGCCFNGFVENATHNSRSLRRWLDIPADRRCYGAMTVGFPAVRYRRLTERSDPPVQWR